MATETKRPWEQKIEDAGVRAEEELRRVVTYLNDEVMPEVRRNGSRALRTAAGELSRLAERMEGHVSPTGAGASDKPGDAGR